MRRTIRTRLLALLLPAAILTRAEKLPLKIYTPADGLAHNSVNRIVRDSHGYLWFCTSEGLSRFDGYEFHNYGRRDGLPHRDVHDVLEAQNGDYWIATSGGLCRYLPKTSQTRKFQVYRVAGDDRASYINVLRQDTQGRIWCGTDAGLFRLERFSGQPDYVLRNFDLGMPKESWDDQIVYAVMQDLRGDLWVGAGSGLYRLRGGGQVERFTTSDGLPVNFVTALMQDQQHRIWAATHEGLCKLIANPTAGQRVVETVFQVKDGLGADSVQALDQLADGTIWAGTKMGLSVARPDTATGAQSFSTYTMAHGLPKSAVETLAEDAAGNLWIGTDGGGAAKLLWKTFLTYTPDDGLAGGQIDSIFADRNGTLCVVTRQESTGLFINEFDGERFRATQVKLPPETRLVNWGARSQSVAQDRGGRWWVATSNGLFRYGNVSKISELARTLPDVRYTEREGLSPGPVIAVFEDSAGGIWASTTGKKNGLAQWDESTHAFRRYVEGDGLHWLPSSGVSLFADNGSSGLWMGLLRVGSSQPELARFRSGTFQRFGGDKDTPPGGIRAVYLDRQKRLWVGTNQTGVMRFDNPSADQPTFTRYTTANGLSSDVVSSLTEDSSGRIYIGSGSGVDRLDAATGEIKRYTTADGLASGEVYAAFRDRSGSLWFGTSGGLSRLVSTADPPRTPPPVVISSLLVGGVRQQTSELGEIEISGLRYQPNQNDIEVGFVGLAFAPAETLRYQYMLEGADSEWSPPVPQRSINFANLSPGSYRFLVRAINSEGVASARPASVAFVILPPVWMRWWFLLLIASTAAAAVYQLHRFRVNRLLDLERVRTRIATDLHDDIGSSLSQIAILSEVANRQVSAAQPDLAEPLADIAGISRELVDSMSDIVWAIDPERDQLGDLVHRMRRFASDVFSARDSRLMFHAPAAEQDLPMGADLRRQIFLIFKEAVHNVLRHSGATEVRISFQVEKGWLHLEVEDNGSGFDVLRQAEGHGLKSMRERAQSIGGQIEISSRRQGAAVVFRVPVGRRMTPRAPAPHE